MFILEFLTSNLVSIFTLYKVVYRQKINQKITLTEALAPRKDSEATNNEKVDWLGQKFYVLLYTLMLVNICTYEYKPVEMQQKCSKHLSWW